MSLEQLQAADLELFKCMAEETNSAIRPTISGVRPLEVSLIENMKAPQVRLFLQPLQGRSGSGGQSSASSSKRKATDSDDEVARLQRKVTNLENRLKNQQSRGSSKGGKGKGGGRTRRTPTLPAELVGMEPTGQDGAPRCCAFNMDGCNKAKPGKKCPKGLHVCMRPGCGRAHSQRDH